ncbi:MAG: nicotinamidase [Methylomicrobium sp.]
MKNSESIASADALLIVDMQNDFLPGGSLAVSGSEQIIPVINRYIEKFSVHGNPIYLTRDWHPPDHFSFKHQGGPWPVHCVADSHGAEFSASLSLPKKFEIVSTGFLRDREGYSGFEETDLQTKLEQSGITRLFVAGVATDYCVLNTVLEALKLGFTVFLLQDAVRAVNVDPGDGDKALQAMRQQGAIMVTLDELS